MRESRGFIDRSTAKQLAGRTAMTLRTVLKAIGTFAWVATLAAGKLAGAIEPPYTPPTATIVGPTDFQGVHGIPPSWQVALGTWQADGQTYNSTAATSAAVTTIFEYD